MCLLRIKGTDSDIVLGTGAMECSRFADHRIPGKIIESQAVELKGTPRDKVCWLVRSTYKAQRQ